MKEKLITLLDGIDEDIVLFEGEDLFDAGVIDSFMVIEIVEEIERNFNIEISADDVVRENFCTVERMLALLKKMMGMKKY